MFVCICALLINDVSAVKSVPSDADSSLQMDSQVFKDVLLPHCLNLVNDKVPNIRMMLGRTLKAAPGVYG